MFGNHARNLTIFTRDAIKYHLNDYSVAAARNRREAVPHSWTRPDCSEHSIQMKGVTQ